MTKSARTISHDSQVNASSAVRILQVLYLQQDERLPHLTSTSGGLLVCYAPICEHDESSSSWSDIL
jgi:hypothetical protein